MSRKNTVNVDFDRIVPIMMEMVGAKTHVEFSKFLNIATQSINNYKFKNKLPLNLVVKFGMDNDKPINDLVAIGLGTKTPDEIKEKRKSESLAVQRFSGVTEGVTGRKDAVTVEYVQEGPEGQAMDLQPLRLEVKKAWIHGFIGDPATLKAWIMNANNMAHDIDRNDILLIDTSQKRINGAGYYAFGFGGRIQIRLVRERLDGSVELVNTNPAFQDQNHKVADPEHMETPMIGRVIFIGGVV